MPSGVTGDAGSAVYGDVLLAGAECGAFSRARGCKCPQLHQFPLRTPSQDPLPWALGGRSFPDADVLDLGGE